MRRLLILKIGKRNIKRNDNNENVPLSIGVKGTGYSWHIDKLGHL